MIKALLSRFKAFSGGAKSDRMLGIALYKTQMQIAVLVKRKHWTVEKSLSQDVQNNEYAATLESVLKTHATDGTQVHLVLASHMYQTVQMEKPQLPDEDIKRSLPFTAKDLVALEPNNILADFIDVPIKQNMQKDKILVFAGNKQQIMPLINVVHDSKATLARVTCEETALLQLFEQASSAIGVVIQHPGAEPNLYIIRDGAVVFIRHLRGFINLPNLSMEEIKMGLLDNLSLELQRSIDFFESQLKQPPLKAIKLTLASAENEAIAKGLSEFLPVKVEPLVPDSPLCVGRNLIESFAIAAASDDITLTEAAAPADDTVEKTEKPADEVAS